MRIRKTQNEADFEKVIDEYITLGYTVQSRGEDTCKLKKKSYGGVLAHLLIFAITFWSFGLVNVIYAYYNYRKGDEVLVKIE